MHSIVTVSDVSFEFSNGRALFKQLNFSLDNRVTALVGPNGVGKTCLARLLIGEMEPSEGTIKRKIEVAYFSQRQLPEAISVASFLGDKYLWSELGEKLLSGINREMLCTHLSGGQWMRVRLVQALEDRYLILDEPTNDLDREGRDALLDFLKQRAGGILLISHDRECLSLCESVLELSNQGISQFGGGWKAFEQWREDDRAGREDALESAKRQRESARQERALQIARQEKRNRRGQLQAERGGLPKILIGARKRRAQVTTGRIDVATMERANEAVRTAYDAYAELKIDPVMYADLLGEEIPNQKLVVEARAFNVRFQDWLYERDLNFSWRGNIRIAIKGGNGSGKSTLLKAIRGTPLVTRGELRVGGLETLYLDQQGSVLNESKSVFENIRDVSRLNESEIRNGLAKFLFPKETVFQKVSSLSGGERLRAALARGLLSTTKPQLLVLDEPTNNVDLKNVEFLERLVKQFRGAIIVISHDEVFLSNSGVTESFAVL